MKYAAIIFLALASCGFGIGEERGDVDDIVVRRYEDVNGHEDRIDPSSLGLTYYVETKGDAKHAELGMNCMVNRTLDGDQRLVNVIIHELLNAILLGEHGGYDAEYPSDYNADWMLYDGDSRDPLYVLPPDEAAWVALHHGKHVHVQGRDEWLVAPVRHACNRINAAAGVDVFDFRD